MRGGGNAPPTMRAWAERRRPSAECRLWCATGRLEGDELRIGAALIRGWWLRSSST
jgi:hypothetical protein